MKLIFWTAMALTLQLSLVAQADDNINCEIVGSRTWLNVNKTSSGQSSVTIYHYNSTSQKDEQIAKFVGSEIDELAYSKFRLSLAVSRNNDILKISSDSDLFGGDPSGHSAKDPVTWKGFIFRSPENMGDPNGASYTGKVSCAFDYSK